MNEMKIKSPYTSEVIDLSCLSLLFVLWERQLNLDKYLTCFSLWTAWGLRCFPFYLLATSKNLPEMV